MSSGPMSSDSVCVISVHSYRPRITRASEALRFMTVDRAHIRQSPGHVWSFFGIAGARSRNHLGLPPSPLARTGIVLWRDQEAFDTFVTGPVEERWRKRGDLSTAWGRPVGGHGPMIQRTMPHLSPSGRTDGPVMVITYLKRSWRQSPRFLFVDVPRSMEGLRVAPGLRSVTGGGTGLRGVTVSCWEESRSMKAWAYDRTLAHGRTLVPAGGDRFADWCFMRVEPLGVSENHPDRTRPPVMFLDQHFGTIC